jgi:hypothetical protein
MKARFATFQLLPVPARAASPQIETTNQSRIRQSARPTQVPDGKCRGVARNPIVVLREFD